MELPPPETIIEERKLEIQQGSQTAKAGFQTERDVVAKFNNWKQSKMGKAWLVKMGVELDKEPLIKAEVVKGSKKADVSLKVNEESFGIQVKLVSSSTGFNQIDKRWLHTYKAMWNIPDDTFRLLQHFTGELPPYKVDTRDKRRMFLSEFTKNEQSKVISFFKNKKQLICTKLLKGSGEGSTDWFMVIQKTKKATEAKWSIEPIGKVIAFYSSGEVKLSPRGSLQIGRMKMQRKGGDNGRPTANMLQFKIDPTEILEKN